MYGADSDSQASDGFVKRTLALSLLENILYVLLIRFISKGLSLKDHINKQFFNRD